MGLSQFGGAAVEAASRALLLADWLLIGPPGLPPRPVPFAVEFGVHGVGLFARSTAAVVPALFVESGDRIDQLATRPLSEFPRAVRALAAVFPLEPPWPDVVAVPVSPVSPHANPGDQVHAGGTGQLGARVAWGSNQKGYLTAGHVGLAGGTTVTDASGGSLGTVRLVFNPPSGGSVTSGVDVAVIEIGGGVTHGNAPSIATTATPSPRAAVDVYTRTGTQPARIYASAKWFFGSATSTTYSEVYLSNAGVTQPGDSGGPVLLSGSAGDLIGHIVCGGATTSCFQDVQHQLQTIRNTPGYSTLHIV